MSLYFTKLFSTLTDSTIWCEDNPTRIVWIAMLAMADRHGLVHASIPGLANRARVSLDECENALNKFMEPDPYSRTEDHEGRRIERIDGGWKLLNYAKYRELGNNETVRESKRKWAEENRKKSNEVESSRCEKKKSIQAEAEAEAEVKKDNISASPPDEKTADAEQRAILAARRRKVIDAYNPIAERNDWFVVDGKPNGTAMDLLNKFCEDEYRFGKLDEYMSKVAQSTMEACRINAFLTKKAFNGIMCGNWIKGKEPVRKGGVDGPAVPEEALDLSKAWNRAPEPEKRSTGIWDIPEGII